MPERTKGLCPSEQKVFVRANKRSLSGRAKGLCPSGQKVFVPYENPVRNDMSVEKQWSRKPLQKRGKTCEAVRVGEKI
ncbi:MAG: hypothetical protein LBM08_05010 [Dysgonamonadaceae bacterium]|nr:hypothetical protein [Dysgonamonadaceae bacterium]